MTGGESSENLSSGAQKNPEIRFSFEGKEIIVRPTEFNALSTDIRRFNNQFSMGSLMASLIFRAFQEENTPKPDQQTQELTAAGIGLIHQDVLDKIGLEIEPVSGKRVTLYGAEEQIGEGELRVNIKDGKRFLGFLKAVDPQITKGTELGENLQSLSNVLAQQIFDHYNLKEPSDEALQLFGSLEPIINEYKRLEIPGVNRLETYLTHSKKGDLREFILVEQNGLLSEPGKNFGPADWQNDATPEYIARRWNEALEVLKMARENPNGQDLYHQLFTHLNNCLNIAIENLEEPAENESRQENKNKLKPVLQEIKESFG